MILTVSHIVCNAAAKISGNPCISCIPGMMPRNHKMPHTSSDTASSIPTTLSIFFYFLYLLLHYPFMNLIPVITVTDANDTFAFTPPVYESDSYIQQRLSFHLFIILTPCNQCNGSQQNGSICDYFIGKMIQTYNACGT